MRKLLLLLVITAIAFTVGHGSSAVGNRNVFWSGHIVIYRDAGGQSHIDYRSDDQVKDTTYTPKGFMETHTVNGLIKRITTP